MRPQALAILLATFLVIACGTEAPAETLAGPPELTAGPLGLCGEIATFTAEDPAKHVPVDSEVQYNSEPPSIGDHYGSWMGWGFYDLELEARYFVHNMEHGGLVFLYNCDKLADPSQCDAFIQPIKDWILAQPEDDGGAFRFVFGKRAALDVPFAAAAWGWTLRSTCVDTDALTEFKAARYRKGPEDVAGSGQHAPTE